MTERRGAIPAVSILIGVDYRTLDLIFNAAILHGYLAQSKTADEIIHVLWR